jgi:hypothetical protein
LFEVNNKRFKSNSIIVVIIEGNPFMRYARFLSTLHVTQ